MGLRRTDISQVQGACTHNPVYVSRKSTFLESMQLREGISSIRQSFPSGVLALNLPSVDNLAIGSLNASVSGLVDSSLRAC
jgi:hypothetical protein